MATSINQTPQFTTDLWAANEAAQKADAVTGGVNPNSQLDKDAFLKLLLVELQHQDPTEPMDSAKMLEQTSQLATVEMQEKTNQVMTQLSEQMQASASLNAMSALGKMANLANSVAKDTPTSEVDFSLYFPVEAKSGTIEIYDTLGNVVRNVSISDVKAGVSQFRWDGKNNNGEPTLPGEYLVKAKYLDASGGNRETVLGQYPVEAVKFDKGVAYIKVAGEYIDMNSVLEFTEPIAYNVTSSNQNSSSSSDKDDESDKPVNDKDSKDEIANNDSQKDEVTQS
ncbi:MAG: flagellar basal body rod modification protein [Campylobacter sp.]|uniref:flagellar basal body rod modification protein n=1 Tax=Campylobacter sp. TaxID=205 RepID=UPI00259CC3EB|nr:flagellar basal body rod modification protein [Campylobacter sp.]MBQ8609956.1 flagellar basal body rod modification protein [Campylobacter sp.]